MMRLFVVFLCLLVLGCSDRNVISQEEAYVAQTIDQHPDITHHYLPVNGHILHYAAHGDSRKPALVIIHGTPGSWRQYARYLLNPVLLKNYYMVVIDRPGWGESVLAGKQVMTSFKEQAHIIAELARELRQQSGNQAVVIMGHSLGASLAPRIAMDFPELIDGLLLFAGTLDPKLSSPRWFNYVGTAPLMKYVIGDQLHRSNQEIFALKDNIAAMSVMWPAVQAEVVAVQGMKDGLVYPANIDFIEQTFPSETTMVVRLDNEGHLFPMTRRDDVVTWSLLLLDRIYQHNGVVRF